MGPTPLSCVEGHSGGPNKVDLDPPPRPESWSSARTHMPRAREPGDLGGAASPVVGSGQPREGPAPQSVVPYSEESDKGIVPKKPTKTRVTPVEPVEGRPAAEGKSASRDTPRAQDRQGVPTQVTRIGQRAKEKKGERFDNLLSAIKAPLLKEAYQRLRRQAAPGVDGVTWEEYGEHLDARLLDLQDRIHRGSYHPQPVRRVHIPKGDGRTRPLGIPALEDKIVQQAARMVLEPIYEQAFLGFSYGFRPRRGQHDALNAVAEAISRKTNWVLDADIRSFYDTIDHGWMQKFLDHRIGDRRMVRLLMKWLHAGVMEDGELREVEAGTPQGGSISPLLANIYLHYALDLWAHQWRKRHAHGEVYIVRYADDLVMTFQREQDVRAMREALTSRLAKFGLELHPEKTRVLRFGRFARQDAERDGRTRPETFDFLGFTHIASVDRRGMFQLKRRTSRKKRNAKLASLSAQIRARRHRPVREQYAWLSSVLQGHYRYYGVPTNYRAMQQFRERVRERWHRQLQRRSQRAHWNLRQRAAFDERFPLPLPRIHHPWPSLQRANPLTRGGSPVREIRSPGSVRGAARADRS
jgi:RNA-directed DNA polymerase